MLQTVSSLPLCRAWSLGSGESGISRRMPAWGTRSAVTEEPTSQEVGVEFGDVRFDVPRALLLRMR